MSEWVTFVTDTGEQIVLDPRHRGSVRIASSSGYGSEVKPGADETATLRYLEAVGSRVTLGLRTLALFGGRIEAADILVIGASDGAEAAWLAGLGAGSVTGTDHGEVFLDVGDGFGEDRRNCVVAAARSHSAALGLGRFEPGRIRFLIDDITASRLPNQSFDVVMSWQTLEHVPDVAAAMRETARLLRPGGLVYHEYNPFFAIDGGHAAATLDMPWGHVRLDDADFERFVRQRRSDEAGSALRFYRTGINRATHHDVRSAAGHAGLEPCAWLPRTRTEDLLLLTPEILTQCERTYPGVTVADLVSRIVRLVVRRP